jgi:endonuclease-3 related protein
MRERLLDISNDFWRPLAASLLPGETPLEVMVGAILTQNTAWRNVEKAIAGLKEQGLLDVDALCLANEDILAQAIRPAGYYRLKAKRLKDFIIAFHGRFGGLVEETRHVPTRTLREWLLAIKGIGPETADSILLYALDRPVFVVDAYTKRFLSNHLGYDGDYGYHEVQRLFTDNLPADIALFNEFHALLVCLCQRHCKKRPDCRECPLLEDEDRRLQERGRVII